MANTVLLLMFSWLPLAYALLFWFCGAHEEACRAAKYGAVFLAGVNLAMVFG